MMRNLLAAFAVAACFATVATPCQAALSTFDASAEDWTIADLPGAQVYTSVLGTYTPVYNPAGYISFSDPTSNTFFFSAPSAYLGNQSTALGSSLRFDLRTTHDTWTVDTVVVLTGNNGTVLVAPFAQPTVGVWNSYNIPIEPGSFRLDNANGAVPTESTLLAVLSDLELLAINAEYANGIIETTDLDNVSFGVIPEPSSMTLALGLFMPMLARRRR